MSPVLGALLPWVIEGAVLGLHLVVPGRWVDGYVRGPDGAPLRYYLNGFVVLWITLAIAAALVRFGGVPADLLYTWRWQGLGGACALGLLFTAAIVAGAPPTGKGLFADVFLGRRPNPQLGRVDAKMALYLVGAVLLELNLLSFGAHHARVHAADPNPGVALHVALFTFFVAEYLWFERVHLYTYDFVAENVGFKLGWGCIVFYPYFYAAGLWSTAEAPNPHLPPIALVGCAALFFAGWTLSRGANLQKYLFKTDPDARLLGVVRSEAITDGEHRLLVTGFWGVSRHVNYLGELGMALGLCLALGHPLDPWTWSYPLYYVALLVPRERDDDRRCAAKYGALWETYRARVRWRIVPGVY